MFYTDETLALFVDGPNLSAASKALDMHIDFGKLLETFKPKGRLLRANYFTPVTSREDPNSIHKRVDWLVYNGWNVITKPGKLSENKDGLPYIRGNIQVELAMAAMKLAPHIDHVVLFSGNRDFIPLVQYLQESGTRVSVASTLETPSHPFIADDLRRQADAFIELAKLREQLTSSPVALSA